MKVIILLLYFSFLSLFCNAQINIYTQEAKQKLGKIVDSLNLRFKKQHLNKKYYARPQAKAHIIYTDKNVTAIKKDIENNISFENFEKKYPNTIDAKDELIIKEIYYDEIDKGTNTNFEIKSLRFNYRNDNKYRKENTTNQNIQWKNKWVIGNFSDNTEYTYLNAIYITEEFEGTAIPEEYGNMISYVDCMIDTNATIILANPKYDEINPTNDKKTKKLKKLSNKFDRFTKQYKKKNPYPKLDNNKFKKSIPSDKLMCLEEIKKLSTINDEYSNSQNQWDKDKYIYIKSNLAKEKDLVLKVYQDCIENNDNTISYMENYLNEILSGSQMLDLIRRRAIIYPDCGTDYRSVFHLQQIEYLTTETAQWDIFLRTHLDLMKNSLYYAYNRRIQKTEKRFIQVVESLNINLVELLIGSILKFEHSFNNHYFNDDRTIGIIFSVSKNKKKFEEQIYTMLADTKLDIYNRILIYHSFLRYLQNINKNDKNDYIIELKILFEDTKEDFWKKINYEEIKNLIHTKDGY